MRGRVLGFLIFLAVCLWRPTLRVRFVGEENRKAAGRRNAPVLHALWHQRLVLGILTHGFHGAVTMASQSADGDVIAGFLRFWGFRVVRGSSSRGGGQALKEMRDVLHGTSAWAALTPDGPRGPARKVKSGVQRLAAELDAAILPVGTSSSRPLFLNSWDRFLVPLPFSRCAVVFGPPVEKENDESQEQYVSRVAAAIDAVTEEADRLCGVVDAPRERMRRAENESTLEAAS
ncbi:MAG: lysophospholipid acyltransferase family protein [Thermoanaerobaculia bacterium]